MPYGFSRGWNLIKWIAGIVAGIIIVVMGNIILDWVRTKKTPLPHPQEISQPKQQEKKELPEKAKQTPPRPNPSEQSLPPIAPPKALSPTATPSIALATGPKKVSQKKLSSELSDLLKEGGILIGNPERYPEVQSQKWPVQMWLVLNGKNESVEGTVTGPTPNDGVFFPVYVGLNRKTIKPQELAEIRRQLRHR